MTPVTPAPGLNFDCPKVFKTRSCGKDAIDEIENYEPSVYSNYTAAPPEDEFAEEEPRPVISDTGTTLADHVRQYEVLLPSRRSIFGSDLSLDRYTAQNVEALYTPRSQLHREQLETPGEDRSAFPSIDPRPSAPSPNTMNSMNERDPAFLGTLGALRPEIKTPMRIRPRSVLMAFNPRNESATEQQSRCFTSLGANESSEGSKKRYFAFVNRLRGRTD